jgi:hypothetical protein
MATPWRREFLSKNCWYNDNGWPVQVMTRVEHHGVDYILYWRLRGRYWEGYVIRGTRCIQDLSKRVVSWSCDVLRYHWLRFDEYQLEQAKQALIRIFQHRYGGVGTELILTSPNYSMKFGEAI